MINRRYLRVKVMQGLYSLNALHEAEHHNIRLWLQEQLSTYKNVLELYEEEDRDTLKQAETSTLAAFDEPSKEAAHLGELDEAYRQPLAELLDEARRRTKDALQKDVKRLTKEMVTVSENLGQRYLSLLQFFPAVVQVAQRTESELSKARAFDLTNLEQNKALRMLQRLPEMNHPPKRGMLNWNKEDAELMQWYKDIIRRSDTLQDYLAIERPKFEDDQDFLRKLLKEVLFKHERVVAFMEAQDIHWEENRAVLRSMTNKTLKNLDPSMPVPELAVLSTNWEEDKEFFEKLFKLTVKHDAMLEELIATAAHNWAADRIALVDKIILKMAITELMNFESIPVKVTLNEYLEVAKLYSSPKSKQFINGLLDRINVDLQQQGKIVKTGRGLLDQ